MDLDAPIPSTSTGTISSRVFAIKVQPKEEDNFKVEEEQHFIKKTISDAINITSSPNEINERGYNVGFPPSSCSTSTTVSTIENDNNFSHPTHPIGSSNSLSVFPVSDTNISHHSTRANNFPATTLTRTPYQPLPPMQHDNIPTAIHTTSSAVILNNPSTLDTAPIQPSVAPVMGRRPSVVAAAQSLLGDKLDDFTEKLAFIKKNIIMSLDSEDEEELSHNNNRYYNTQAPNSNNKNRRNPSLDHIGALDRQPPQRR